MNEKNVEVYYLRDTNRENRPVVTVAVCKTDEGVYARGVSICSSNDPVAKTTGRSIALGRLKKAIARKTNFDPINHQTDNIKQITSLKLDKEVNLEEFKYKAAYNTELISFEKKLLEII